MAITLNLSKEQADRLSMIRSFRDLSILLGRLNIKCCKFVNTGYIPPYKWKPHERLYGWELDEYTYGFTPIKAAQLVQNYLDKIR